MIVYLDGFWNSQTNKACKVNGDFLFSPQKTMHPESQWSRTHKNSRNSQSNLTHEIGKASGLCSVLCIVSSRLCPQEFVPGVWETQQLWEDWLIWRQKRFCTFFRGFTRFSGWPLMGCMLWLRHAENFQSDCRKHFSKPCHQPSKLSFSKKISDNNKTWRHSPGLNIFHF